MWSYTTLATIIYGSAALIESGQYRFLASCIMGTAFVSIASVPCGLSFFNKNGLKLLQYLAWVGLGITYLFLAFHQYV